MPLAAACPSRRCLYTGTRPVASCRQRTGKSLLVRAAAAQPAGHQHKHGGWKGVSHWLVNTSTEQVTECLQEMVGDNENMEAGTFTGVWTEYRDNTRAHIAGAKNGIKNKWPRLHQQPGQALGGKQPPAPVKAKFCYGLKPPSPLIADLVMYGEMVQAVYDTLEIKDIYSEFFGNRIAGTMQPGTCLGEYSPPDGRKAITVGPKAAEYKILQLLEADSGAYKLKRKEKRNYVGFIAESPPDEDLGVDIAIVFRGTITQDEWVQDFKAMQVRWNAGRPLASPPKTTLSGSLWKGSLGGFICTYALLLTLFVLLPNLHYLCEAMWSGVEFVLLGPHILGSFMLGVGHQLVELLCSAPIVGDSVKHVVEMVAQLLDKLQHALNDGWQHMQQLGIAVNNFVAALLHALGSQVPEPCKQRYEAFTKLAAGTWFSILSFTDEHIGWLFRWTVGLQEGVNVGAASFTLVAAVALWLLEGLFAGWLSYDDRNEWKKDWQSWRKVLMPWAGWGIWNYSEPFVSMLRGEGAAVSDPRMSYGFKEMYADAQAEEEKKTAFGAGNAVAVPPAQPPQGAGQKPKEGWASPRLTVLKTLADHKLLKSRTSKAGAGRAASRARAAKKALHIKSITVTGHSLGGALASLCGWDIADTFDAALTGRDAACSSWECADTALKWLGCNMEGNKQLYDDTEEQRSILMSNIKELHKSRQLPAIGVVTFAAPRVGNKEYEQCFNGRSLMDPLQLAEPLDNDRYEPRRLARMGIHFRDRWGACWQSLWYKVGKAQIEAAAKSGKDLQGRKVEAGMLRVVNSNDIFPRLPTALPIPRLYWYRHGGHELRLNSYYIPYFARNGVLGSSLGAMHNLEMYLHMLDPSRPMALVNKSDSVLDSRQEVLSRWWSPEAHRGTRYLEEKQQQQQR